MMVIPEMTNDTWNKIKEEVDALLRENEMLKKENKRLLDAMNGIAIYAKAYGKTELPETPGVESGVANGCVATEPRKLHVATRKTNGIRKSRNMGITGRIMIWLERNLQDRPDGILIREIVEKVEGASNGNGYEAIMRLIREHPGKYEYYRDMTVPQKVRGIRVVK